MGEGLPRPQKTESEKGPSVSRREMLKGLLGAAALSATGALDAVSVPAKAAEAIEVKEKSTAEIYSEGIERLRRAAIESPNEQSAVFAELPDGDVEWIYGTEGQGSSVSLNDVSEKLYEEYGNEKQIVATVFHTHPLKTIKEFVAFRESSVQPFQERLSMPPSARDFEGACMQLRQEEQRGNEFFKGHFSMVDPQGVWTYGVDPNNEEVQDHVARIARLVEMLDTFKKQHPRALPIMQEINAAGDATHIFSLLMNDERLSETDRAAAKELSQAAEKAYTGNPLSRFLIEREAAGLLDPTNAVEVQTHIDLARSHGLILTFKPHGSNQTFAPHNIEQPRASGADARLDTRENP